MFVFQSENKDVAFNKIQYPFMIKALKKLSKVSYLNTIKVICDENIAIFLFNVEKLLSAHLKSRMREGCPFSPLH